MRILGINVGSSTVKFSAIDMARSSPALHGLGFLVFVVFAVALSANMVTPLLPTMLSQYSLSLDMQARHAAFLTGSYLLAMFVAAPTFGTLSDRIDRRAILLSAMAVPWRIHTIDWFGWSR